MSIQELSLKFKGLLNNTEYVLTVLIIGVSLISFYLGRSSVGNETSQMYSGSDVHIDEHFSSIDAEQTLSTTDTEKEKTGYVASKNGTKYHLPWCPGAQQIREENKRWFASKEDAETAGYTPAANCKGI